MQSKHFISRLMGVVYAGTYPHAHHTVKQHQWMLQPCPLMKYPGTHVPVAATLPAHIVPRYARTCSIPSINGCCNLARTQCTPVRTYLQHPQYQWMLQPCPHTVYPGTHVPAASPVSMDAATLPTHSVPRYARTCSIPSINGCCNLARTQCTPVRTYLQHPQYQWMLQPCPHTVYPGTHVPAASPAGQEARRTPSELGTSSLLSTPPACCAAHTWWVRDQALVHVAALPVKPS